MARLAAASACPVSVSEAHDGAQSDGLVAIGEVTQDAAGGDGSQLLVITDEAHTGPACQGVGDHDVEIQRGGHTGLVDDQQGVRVDGGEPFSGRIIGGCGFAGAGFGELDEFGDGVGGSVEVGVENFGRTGGGASPITLPPALRQAPASAAIAVVFPVPAGARASWTRAPKTPFRVPAPPGRR